MAKVLICDPVGLRFDGDGRPDHSEIKDYIQGKGGLFHLGGFAENSGADAPGKVNFYYRPDLATEEELLDAAAGGAYDAVIAAATIVPDGTSFPLGGVRIGVGTGNMRSRSWGGCEGRGGDAPLMNTPGTNSRATAQMAIKAMLSVLPDIPVDLLHRRVLRGDFDTSRHIKDFPTEKLEGMRMAVLGFGNIGVEVASLAASFRMNVAVYARSHHRERIEAAGHIYAGSPVAAARDARVLSVHVGLGSLDPATSVHTNASLVDETVLAAMRSGSVVINYDRGEVVDVPALDRAMTCGHIRHAFVDADIFVDEATGEVSGPLKPYLEPARRLEGRLRLLPHVAADTDHPSRVTGAKRAVDQIMDAIMNKRLSNLIGDLPDGYSRLGDIT